MVQNILYLSHEGIDFLSLAIFARDPEKLLHVAFSLIISSTADFGRQVKLPNLIDCPVKTNVKYL